jgi:hypothetical protein
VIGTHKHWGRVGHPRLALSAIFLLSGCGIFPEKVSVDDQRVQSLLKAAAVFDRASYGFSPLPMNGYVDLELRSRSNYHNYDAMLHIYQKTSRTIAFRKNANGYDWIGEQEAFVGPKMYKTANGTLHEQVVLNFDTERVSGFPLNQLGVEYMGEDPRLSHREDLSLSDVKPVLKEWGY